MENQLMNREDIRTLIFKSSMLLDAEDFKGFLEVCGDTFSYKISAYSPELGQDMIWLEHDRKEMEGLFEMLPKHVRMPGKFKRHVSIYSIDESGGDRAQVVSSLLVVHTDPHGASTLFAAGQYTDLVDTAQPSPRLLEREVRLDTRVLGPGVHVPI